jgi:hypothetical protein
VFQCSGVPAKEEFQMSNDLTKRADPTVTEPIKDTASRLKHDLMKDSLGRMFGKDDEKPVASGTPRILLAVANHGRSPGWEHAKAWQRQMYGAAGSSGLEMKFAFYAEDNDRGVRRFKITTDWIVDSNRMAALINRNECSCGCYVNIRSVLQRAVEENADRPMRAVVIVGDAFHDDEDSLTEAALAANELRRAGTRVILIQEGDDPHTARKLQYLRRISGAVYFMFDSKTQQRQLAEMLKTVSTFATGGEEAVKAAGGQAANLLLEHFKQQPMPLVDTVAPAKVPLARS